MLGVEAETVSDDSSWRRSAGRRPSGQAMSGARTKTGPRSVLGAATVFQACVVVPTVALLVVLVVRQDGPWKVDLLIWTAVVAVVELIQVPAWQGLQVSIAFPILLAVGLTHPPALAALVAFVGSFDPREFKREISPLRALFNRSQVALAVLAASATFHALTSVDQPWLV